MAPNWFNQRVFFFGAKLATLLWKWTPWQPATQVVLELQQLREQVKLIKEALVMSWTAGKTTWISVVFKSYTNIFLCNQCNPACFLAWSCTVFGLIMTQSAKQWPPSSSCTMFSTFQWKNVNLFFSPRLLVQRHWVRRLYKSRWGVGQVHRPPVLLPTSHLQVIAMLPSLAPVQAHWYSLGRNLTLSGGCTCSASLGSRQCSPQ